MPTDKQYVLFSILLKAMPKLKKFCSSNKVESCLCKAILFVEIETPQPLHHKYSQKNFTFVDFRNPVDTYRTVHPCSTDASWQYINLAIS